MKKLCILLSILVFKSGIVYASDNFLDYDWWETATLEDVQAEIANGADVNAKNDNFDGWTALMYALCDNKDIEIIKALLDAGADVKIIDNNETTTLMHGARYHDNPEVIKMLMENGVDIDAKNDVDWTALMYAVTHNRNREIIKLLIDAGADVRVTDSKGRTLLMLANYQNPEIIKVLAESGVDILAKDDDDRTALHHAADVFNQNPELIKSLIELGIKVNAKDNDGLTALMVAANNRNSEVVQELINAGADVNAKSFIGKTALMFAANWGDSKITKALMNAGADVNTKDMNGLTALMVAAINNKSPEVVQELINAGADVNAKDNEGNTALSIAKQQNASPEIIKLLTGKNTNFHDVNWWKTATVEDVKTEIANGADVNAKDKYGSPALMLAVIRNKNPEIIRALVELGANVNARNNANRTALIYAAESNKNPEVIRTLVELGADVNARDMNGSTPLTQAASLNKNPEVIRALIELGADVNAKDILNDATPLVLALSGPFGVNPEVIRTLVELGADVNTKDKYGKTALDIAKQQNASPEIIKLLTGKNTNFQDANWWKTATLEDVKTEIANGADVNLEVEDDETHIMPILGMAIAKFIINPNDSNNDENYKIIELLIDAGADVNAKMKTVHVILKEEIPLLIFAFAAENYKSIKVMEKLIDAGADINMQGGHILVKQSPLMSTSEIEKTKFLIESGADVNAYSEGLWGITALMLAIRNQKAEIIKVLIDAGADVNAKCIARNINEDELIKNLYIPSKLVELDKQKYLEEAKKFVEEFKKVSPNREFIGATPLIIAAENSNPEIIRMLIDAGADTSLKSADNKTALDIAKEKNGNPEVIEILEHHQEFDEMFAECYSTQNIGKYANKFCKCAIKSAIDALGPADKEKAKDAFDDARAGTFKNLIQKGKSAAFNECY